MTTISLLAYAEGHPETGNANDPQLSLTLEIDRTAKDITDYKNGVANSVSSAIRAAIQESGSWASYAQVGWKSSTITIVGATEEPPTPAPTGLQLTIQKTVATRSVEKVDMTNHWTAFGGYLAAALERNDMVLECPLTRLLESYFRSIAGPDATHLVVKT